MHNENPDWENEATEPPSKSELKRRMRDLQDLADALSRLKSEELMSFDLPDSLVESLETARRLKSSNARNRQLRHASKLLDKCGEQTLAQIFDFFDQRQKQAQSHARRHRSIEQWRDRLLIDQKKEIENLLQEYPDVNLQELRTLVRLAAKEQSQGRPPTQQRRLFCYLRDNVIV